MLERSTHFFLLEMEDRTDKVSTLRLKAARTTSGYGASKPAAQGSPCCAGTTCPHAAAKTAGAAASGDLQPSSYNATKNYVHFFSIRPPSSHRPAAEPTQPLSLPLQSLGEGGGDLWWRTICFYCVSCLTIM